MKPKSLVSPVGGDLPHSHGLNEVMASELVEYEEVQQANRKD